MKLLSVLNKSLKEQIRNFWVLVLTITMAPFFVFVYYLINEATKPHYDLLILNQDKGIEYLSEKLNYGNLLIEASNLIGKDTLKVPLSIIKIDNISDAIQQLKNRKADALVIIPEDFSEKIHNLAQSNDNKSIKIEFVGDLTNVNYMVSAIWAGEILNNYIFEITKKVKPVVIKETSLGTSGKMNDFDLFVPGILILSIIMLMFSATIAIVYEVENKTITRLKLSKLNSFEFLTGISIVQVFVGIVSILLTLIVAVCLGFDPKGSFFILILIAILTSISIIAFSLIIAAITKTATEVLIVGNFPLLLFMFFTGAAFPMKGKELFSIAGYSVTLQGLMSPTHAISALNKVLIMEMGLKDIFSEIIALIVLTIIYFIIGLWAFQKRHMKVE
jgi:ABC-2 type transport system permease protein